MKPTPLDILPRPYRRRAVGVTCTIFLRALLNLAGLAVLLPVLVLILDSDSLASVPWLAELYRAGGFQSRQTFIVAVCAGVAIAVTLKCLLNLLLYRYERNFVYDLYRDLSRRLFRTYHDRGLAFLKRSNTALLARNVNVVSLAFVTGVLRPAASMLSDGLLLLLLLGAVAWYNPLVAGMIVLIFLPSAWLYYSVVRRRLARLGAEENRAQRRKARTVADLLRGYADMEVAGAFPVMLGRFDEALDEVVAIRSRNATLSTLPQLFMEIGLAVGMGLLVVGTLGMDGARLRLLFGIFAVAALRLMPSVRNLMSAWSSIRYNRYTVEVLRDALRDGDNAPFGEKPTRSNDRAASSERNPAKGSGTACGDKTDNATPDTLSSDGAGEVSCGRLSLRHEIEVCRLSFRYDDREPERWTIRDLSFTVRKGERVGIRGASGVGKTTLFNLLLGFYTPASGSIRIDGEPLTAANRRAWLDNVGYVAQHVFLTDGTLIDNVAPGLDTAQIDRARALEALAAAGLDGFAATLPQGPDTPVGECGCRLSGGERQRIGIARALYKQAGVLLLDEATSALDIPTEERINRSLETLMRTRPELTVLVIAHRESTLSHCDRIIDLTQP